MKLLLDTHLLLWISHTINPHKSLSKASLSLIQDENNTLLFSPASLWEIAIKNSLNKVSFNVDPRQFRRTILDNDFLELPINSEHAAAISNLPNHHKDPFDRLLLAQATVEGITLLTNDEIVASYITAPVQLIH
jgi:PIN domain nuclease of toxin-antitoxin system